MKRKNLLLLTVLLTQTVPVWAMEDEDFFGRTGPAHPQNQGARREQPQIQFECIEYFEADQAHPHPRGKIRIFPRGEELICDLLNPQRVRFEAIMFPGINLENLPEDLGRSKEKVKYTFVYEGNQHPIEILCPTFYPLQGEWEFTREEKRNKRDVHTLKLKTLINQQSHEVYQLHPDVKYVPHEQTREDEAQLTGRLCFEGGTSVGQQRQVTHCWKSPREGAIEHSLPIIETDKGKISTHHDYRIIYVEPFPLGNNQPRASYRGKYTYGGPLDA